MIYLLIRETQNKTQFQMQVKGYQQQVLAVARDKRALRLASIDQDAGRYIRRYQRAEDTTTTVIATQQQQPQKYAAYKDSRALPSIGYQLSSYNSNPYI